MNTDEFKKQLELLNEKVINFKKYEHIQGKSPEAFGKTPKQRKVIPSKLTEHKMRLRNESLSR